MTLSRSLIINQDHILFGPAYRVNVITTSSLINPQYAQQAVDDFNSKQEGMLTNSGSDFLGMSNLSGTMNQLIRLYCR